MIQDIVEKAVKSAEAVKALTTLHDQVRTIASSDEASETEARENAAVSTLLSIMPEDTAFRLLEHCSTLTRLYAIWERFVTQAVRHWLDELPSYHKVYSELGDRFSANHRRGVGRILLDLDKDRFSHISVDQTISGLMDAVTGSSTYSILPEAFLFDNRSLKRERLEELFTQVNLERVWHWVSANRHVTQFLTDVKGDQNTAEAELRNFINYRNDAAHGNVDQVLGTGPLTEAAEFILALCRALGEFVLWNQTIHKETSGKVKRAGKVTESYQNNVVVAKLSDCDLHTGMKVLVYGDKYCYPATIESLQLDDVAHAEISIDEECEVGIKFNVFPQKAPVIFLEPPVVVEAVAELMEVNELIDNYAAGPQKLRDAIAEMTPEQIDAAPVPGKWSTRQVICHLADFEPVYANRMKHVIAEDQPSFAGGFHQQFTEHLVYDQRDIEEELKMIEVTRSQMARILRSLPSEAFERTGIHSVDGPMTLRALLERITNHIPHHAQFIEEKKQAMAT